MIRRGKKTTGRRSKGLLSRRGDVCSTNKHHPQKKRKNKEQLIKLNYIRTDDEIILIKKLKRSVNKKRDHNETTAETLSPSDREKGETIQRRTWARKFATAVRAVSDLRAKIGFANCLRGCWEKPQ